MTHVSKIPRREFHTITIVMLNALVEKVDNMHKEMDNFYRQMETIESNGKAGMKNAAVEIACFQTDSSVNLRQLKQNN